MPRASGVPSAREREDQVGEGPREVGPVLDEDERRRARLRGAPPAARRRPGRRAGRGWPSARRGRGGPDGGRTRRRGRGAAARRPRAGPSGAASNPPRPASASAAGTRVRMAIGSQPRPSSPNATSSSARSMTSWLDGSWKTTPIRATRAAGSVLATGRAVELKIPVQSPGRRPRDEPGDCPGQGALARSGGSRHDETGARCQVEGDARDGRPGPARIGDGDVAGDDGDRDRAPETGAGARSIHAAGCRALAQAAPPGKPSRTPAWRSARTRKSDPPATMTTAEMAIRTPNRIIVASSTSGK